MYSKNKYFKLSALAALSISFFLIFNFATNKQDALALTKADKQKIEVFKTPSCGCCYGYVLFLEEEKFAVKQTDMRSLHTVKKKYNIPLEMQSCHTSILGKYLGSFLHSPLTKGDKSKRARIFFIYLRFLLRFLPNFLNQIY